MPTKTNVDYQIIGSFVLQDENTDLISEALKVLKIDNCEEEINALEALFPRIAKQNHRYSTRQRRREKQNAERELNTACRRITIVFTRTD